MTEDEWMKAAMHDDSLVVELLLGLSHRSVAKHMPADLPLHWSVRQRRSKPVLFRSKKVVAVTDSPTTPLSWSGDTSGSSGAGVGSGGAVDGVPENSSYPPPPHPPLPSNASGKARSKQLTQTNEKSKTKRSRKKKTMAELKEDEIVLLRERRLLKKELAILRLNLEKQKATNENLQRMKPGRDVTPMSSVQQNRPCNAELPQTFASHNFPAAVQEELVRGLEISFALPDLNLPLEVD
ncbi:unnamed protein product [Cuscuta europaea]|uniref:Uncharacterized protein n=1 Tax=Cuscuta europaea TaxID=41803 RepID=A0A9P1EG94_CUSEU|nr:unnamed protein product [Cuscuta europaea]